MADLPVGQISTANSICTSSLRTQGPIATGLPIARKPSNSASQKTRHGVWVPAFAGTTLRGERRFNFSSSARERNCAHRWRSRACAPSRRIERFPAKWIPVRVKKTRQNKELGPPFRYNRNGKGSSRESVRCGHPSRRLRCKLLRMREVSQGLPFRQPCSRLPTRSSNRAQPTSRGSH